MYLGENSRLSQKVIQDIFDASIHPLLLSILFLMILYQTKSVYSITERFQLALLTGFLFLLFSVNGWYKCMGYYRIILELESTAYGVGGLGISLFAYRLSRFKGMPRYAVLLWALIAGITLNIVISGLCYLS